MLLLFSFEIRSSYVLIFSVLFIAKHGSIEEILKTIDRKKYQIPKEWIPGDQDEEDTDKEDDENTENNQDPKPEPAYVQARKLFHQHEVLKGSEIADQLKWKEPQVEELTKFLVEQNGFSAERVSASIEKLQKAFKANQKPQSRMDSFFSSKPNPLAAEKRKKKVDEQKTAAKGNKKAKTAGGRNKR